MSGKSAGRVSEATTAAVKHPARDLGYRPTAPARRLRSRTAAAKPAARELGCRPNAAARALRSGTAAAVGLVVSDVTHPFCGKTLRGAQRAAWEAGHVVVLIDDAYGAAWGDQSVELLRTGA